ncbi:solute carrier family 35 member F6-like [Oscarella lobularis]|uniref:solute carrier family 35 member F6-like n=1 Tax=Oscarella lobularis TaxID=121494 RepID=UPI003313EEDF
MAKLSRLQIVLALGMLVTGSINTLSKKAQNDCKVAYNFSAKAQRTVHQFDHPWFQTLVMFVGESLCLFGFAVHRCLESRRRKKEKERYMSTNAEYEGGDRSLLMKRPPVFHWIFIIPTCCDLIGTSLAGIGLVYVNASVWQMLRGSIIIFTGLLSVIFLKRKLRCIHWMGISTVVFGLCCVGLSDVFNQEQVQSSWHTILGIILIVCSQIVSASQMVIEETFLKKRGFHPLQVVGMEGFFGVILMTGAVLPAMYHIRPNGKPYEDSLDAFYQMISSGKLLAMILVYLCSIAFYNYFGLAVTKSLTAVHRTLIDALRTILVWIVELILFYAGAKQFGEQCDWWDFVQLDGFAFLLIGTAMYNGLMEFPCLKPAMTPTEQVRDALIGDSRDPSVQDGLLSGKRYRSYPRYDGLD